MKRLIITIGIGVLLLSGCTTLYLSEKAYNEVGEEFAHLIVKYQRVNQVEDSSNQEENATDSELVAEDLEEVSYNDPIVQSQSGTQQSFNIQLIKTMVVEDELKEETDEDVYPYLEATDGMVFLKVVLALENLQSEPVVFEQWLEKSQVKLLIGEAYLYTPIPTLLLSDLTNQQLEIKSGELLEGYFAFLIPKDIIESAEEAQLLITNENEYYHLTLDLLEEN